MKRTNPKFLALSNRLEKRISSQTSSPNRQIKFQIQKSKTKFYRQSSQSVHFSRYSDVTNFLTSELWRKVFSNAFSLRKGAVDERISRTTPTVSRLFEISTRGQPLFGVEANSSNDGGDSTRGVRRVQRVGWPGRGIARRIERDRRKERQKGREQRVREGWRGERPLGSRTAIETHRLTCVLGIFLFFFFFFSSFLSPLLPATSGTAETTTVSSTWAMVVSEEFVNWNSLKKCRNTEIFD